MHYFIGHNYPSPRSEARDLAATAAHITHMLRDTYEDTAAGYYNIPREVVELYGIHPGDITSEPYRAWVRQRVDLARRYFQSGKDYLAQVGNSRCRIAGYAYTARFEWVLNAIERKTICCEQNMPSAKAREQCCRWPGPRSYWRWATSVRQLLPAPGCQIRNP